LDSAYDLAKISAGRVRDRFLCIEMGSDKVIILNDYAGTIPIYYSSRNHISISNIEPIVVADSKSSYDDISAENLFGFLRYSHFIWDETLYKHIFTQEPDSKYCYVVDSLEVQKTYLETLKCSDERAKLSDYQVANELYELNRKLIYQSLENEQEIILPLSAGYDSRMIISAISEDLSLKKRLKCFTYGPAGSIEVESARKLSLTYKISWKHISLPCKFHEMVYLDKIGEVFGTSLHFHGMYQLEFWDEIKNYLDTDRPVITSGFMTGVPAGQHISLLGINSYNSNLSTAMNNFSQSKLWSCEELIETNGRFRPDMVDLSETRFRKAFERFNGTPCKKSVVFDLWTRQRNFIGYYPRTFEWMVPHISPHMTPEYANFFLSLSNKHLKDRKAVELMFLNFYPLSAKITSNSNGIEAIKKSYIDKLAFFISKIARKAKISNIMPLGYRNLPVILDLYAIKYSEKNSFYPLFNLNGKESDAFAEYFSYETMEFLYKQIIEKNDSKSFRKLLVPFTFAYGLRNINQIEIAG